MSANSVLLEITARTNTGMVRDANEDNFVVTQNCTSDEWVLPKEQYTNSQAGTVLVVADGMGGLNAGEVASKIAVEAIKDYFLGLGQEIFDRKGTKALLLNSLVDAHKKIVQHSKDFPETEGMGSTIVMCWIIDNWAHIGWVGDSRCYVHRNGVLKQLSKDHSFVQSLVDKGEITEEQAFFHPDSNIITQSLGDAGRMPKPDYASFELTSGDDLLLCSDGLNSMLQDNAIAGIVSKKLSLVRTAEVLIEEANKEGGNDNITVVLARVLEGGNETTATHITENVANTEQKKNVNKNWLTYIIIAIVSIAVGYFANSIFNPTNKLTIGQPVPSNSIKKDTGAAHGNVIPLSGSSANDNKGKEDNTPADPNNVDKRSRQERSVPINRKGKPNPDVQGAKPAEILEKIVGNGAKDDQKNKTEKESESGTSEGNMSPEKADQQPTGTKPKQNTTIIIKGQKE